MKNYWRLALTISVLFHTAILVESSHFLKKSSKQRMPVEERDEKEIKMVPKEIKKIAKKQMNEFSEAKPLPYVENVMSKLMQSNEFSPLTKPQIFKKNVKEIIFSESLQIDKRLKRNPAYMNYYRMVREKIRANAYIKAGADAIMIHSKDKKPDEILEFCKKYNNFEYKVPLVAVPSTYSHITEKELIDSGINIVIYANHLLRSAYPAMKKTAENILKNHSCKEASEKYCMPIKEILTLIPDS